MSNRITHMYPQENAPTAKEQQGVDAIIYLQGLDDDIEPKDTPEEALKGWRSMTDSQRRRTMTTYTTLKPSQNN